ncbi:MAG: VOC family protein [Patescibacteria group bacterium]
MPNRVSHFEIHAENPERAIEFYTKIFGWKITKWEGGQMEYWMVETGGREEAGGINGGLVRRTGPAPANDGPISGYVCTMTVESYDDMHEKILANGGSVALPKMALVGMAWQGYYKDTEGNCIGIHQPDTNAK